MAILIQWGIRRKTQQGLDGTGTLTPDRVSFWAGLERSSVSKADACAALLALGRPPQRNLIMWWLCRIVCLCLPLRGCVWRLPSN